MARTLVTMAGAAVVVGLAACSSYRPPVERLASTEVAMRLAKDTGAEQLPEGRIHLWLAKQQITQARALMGSGENERADFVLMRAQADAELAIGEAQEFQARVEADQALQVVATLRASLSPEATSVTTTTGATVPIPINPPTAPPPPPPSTPPPPQGGNP
jgi:Domain of unknown function (DUF4398)